MIEFLKLARLDDPSSLDSDDERPDFRAPKIPRKPEYCYCFAACPLYGTYYSIWFITNFAQAQIGE
jgi:hypothetical protein